MSSNNRMNLFHFSTALHLSYSIFIYTIYSFLSTRYNYYYVYIRDRRRRYPLYLSVTCYLETLIKGICKTDKKIKCYWLRYIKIIVIFLILLKNWLVGKLTPKIFRILFEISLDAFIYLLYFQVNLKKLMNVRHVIHYQKSSEDFS